MTTETTSTTTAPDTRITIEITETTVATFVLTPEQLADYDRPTTLHELGELDEEAVDSLALLLIENQEKHAFDFEVTDRETVFGSPSSAQ